MMIKITEILVMEGIAILMFVFAYLIGVKGKLKLIAGYNDRTESRVTDKEGLKRLIARTCLLVGIGTALMPVLTYFTASGPLGIAPTIGGYAGFVIGIISLVMLQARDYIK